MIARVNDWLACAMVFVVLTLAVWLMGDDAL